MGKNILARYFVHSLYVLSYSKCLCMHTLYVNGCAMQLYILYDLQTCYDWFCKGIADLEVDTQSQLFQKEILKLDLNKLTPTGTQLDSFYR